INQMEIRMGTMMDKITTLQEERNQLLLQMNAQSNTVASTLATPRIQFRLPDKCTGTDRNDSIEAFKLRMDLYFLANKSSFTKPLDKIIFTIQQLDGAALKYLGPFLPYLGTNQAATMLTSYPLLFAELNKLYGSPD